MTHSGAISGSSSGPVGQRSAVESLEITIAEDEVSFSGVGGRRVKGTPQFTEETFRRLDELRQNGKPEEYGRVLFGATFPGDLEKGYTSVRQEMEQNHTRWRVRLDIDEKATRLHSLWWECLYDDRPTKRPLATHAKTPLSRFYSLGNVGQPIRAERLTILVVISNPRNLGRDPWRAVKRLRQRDEEQTLKVINEALSGLQDRVEVKILDPPATTNRIRDALTKGVHVLHVVAQGGFIDDRGFLLLETADRRVDPVADDKAANLVSGLDDLRLVVLAACQSAKRSIVDPFVGIAPRILYSEVPAVVAMQDQVSVDAARTFTEYFYKALFARDADGMVDAAINQARDQLFLGQGSLWEWAIPVLFMRGDGRLFAPMSAPTPGTTTTGISTDPLDDRARRAQLFDLLGGLNDGQMKPLCWQLGFRYDELEGETHEERIVALIERWCTDDDKLKFLVDRVWQMRKADRKRREEQEEAIVLRFERRADQASS